MPHLGYYIVQLKDSEDCDWDVLARIAAHSADDALTKLEKRNPNTFSRDHNTYLIYAEVDITDTFFNG